MEGNHDTPPKTTGNEYDRTLAEYEANLLFPTEKYAGKNVLEIGAGKHLAFSKEAAKKGISVISLNPELKHAEMRGYVGQIDGKTVAGDGLALPLKDNSVDAVTAYESVPRYLDTVEDINRSFLEMMRVLKPGGTAYVGYKEQSWKEPRIQACYTALKNTGHEVRVEEKRFIHPDTHLPFTFKVLHITKKAG